MNLYHLHDLGVDTTPLNEDGFETCWASWDVFCKIHFRCSGTTEARRYFDHAVPEFGCNIQATARDSEILQAHLMNSCIIKAAEEQNSSSIIMLFADECRRKLSAKTSKILNIHTFFNHMTVIFCTETWRKSLNACCSLKRSDTRGLRCFTRITDRD